MRRIAPDKWKHFFAGIVMGLVLEGAGLLLLGELTLAVNLVMLSMIVAVSYGFEVFSKLTGLGHYDVMDAVASVAGGIVAMGVFLLFLILI